MIVFVGSGNTFREIGRAWVTPGVWADYTFAHSLSQPASLQIRVRFDNDAVLGTEDRNLFIDKVAVEPPANQSVSAVKALLHKFTRAFVSDTRNLAYDRRLDGPTGTGVIESPENIAREYVGNVYRPYGYSSGIADLAYHNGMLVYALCDAYERTGDTYFADLARRLTGGLMEMSTVSPVRGFVPRGPHPNGKSYYRDSSIDQHTLYVAGLWRYYRSPIATTAEKTRIRGIINDVVRRLESPGNGLSWTIRVEDNSRDAYAGGSLLTLDYAKPTALLAMIAAAYDVTGDSHWQEEYARLNTARRWDKIVQPYTSTFYMFFNQHILRTDMLRRLAASATTRAQLDQKIQNMASRAISDPYLSAWSHKGLGSDRTDVDPPASEIEATLAPLGLSVTSPFTVLDLWPRYDRSQWVGSEETMRYESLTLAIPALAWQMALLSRRPELADLVHGPVGDMLSHTDFTPIRSDWTYNYALLAAVWSVAFPSSCQL